MKRMFLALAGLLAMNLGSTAATTISLWDFNSVPPDTSTTTGTTAPAVGLGVASLVGGTTAQFAGGELY